MSTLHRVCSCCNPLPDPLARWILGTHAHTWRVLGRRVFEYSNSSCCVGSSSLEQGRQCYIVSQLIFITVIRAFPLHR